MSNNQPLVEKQQPPILPEESNNSLKEKIMGKSSKLKSNLNFAKNATLNDLLNETAMGNTRLEVEPPSPVSLSEPFSSGAPLPMNTVGLPPEVANAMTRDYSSLMKAIDKKKNSRP
jgi:hypothetical protein